MNILLDFETRSHADIKKVGVYNYASHPTTEVLCCAVKLPNETVIWFPKLYTLGHRDIWANGWKYRIISDEEFFEIAKKTMEAHAHNAQFERLIWQYIMVPRYGFPSLPINRWRCTAAQAAALALPRGLDMLGSALGLGVLKDKEGHKLMLKMCRPQKQPAQRPPRLLKAGWKHYPPPEPKSEYIEDEASLIRLGQYCIQDVEVEDAAHRRMPQLPASEQKIWELDQQINDRGVAIDLEGCRLLHARVMEAKEAFGKELSAATGGKITKASQRDKIMKFLAEEQDLDLENLRKSTVDEVLKDLPDGLARRILEIRQTGSLTSVAKLLAMIMRASPDGRVRGCHLYSGASTKRWAGQGIQGQNFPRDSFKTWEEIQAVLEGRFEGCVIKAASRCLRGLIMAQGGRQICAWDYVSIEAVITAWLADEQTALDVFRQGLDPYKVVASWIFNVPYEEVTKEQRQFGKVPELACIAEGQLVLTDQGLVPIEAVTREQKVWDGVDFVPHDGVLYKGIKEVISYDGLTATADHLVWTEGEPRPMAFELAAASGKSLLRSGVGREGIRIGKNHPTRKALPGALDDVLCGHGMYEMPLPAMDILEFAIPRDKQRVPDMLATSLRGILASEKDCGHGAEVYESEGSGVQELWRSGHKVPVPFGSGRVDLGSRQFGAEQKIGVRPDRQQRSLRAGESALRHSIPAMPQHSTSRFNCGRRNMGQQSKPLHACNDQEAFSPREDKRRHDSFGPAGGDRAAKMLEGHSNSPVWARVFDIVNAGPSNRFTVADKLVHNCGFGGWIGALRKFELTVGVSMGTDERCEEILYTWRGKRPMTKKLWEGLEAAAIETVQTGKAHQYMRITFSLRGDYLFMHLPSGGKLAYPFPQLERRQRFGKWKDVVTFMGMNSYTHQWERCSTYGGKLTENAVQATARDILCDGIVNLDFFGQDIVLLVHDEIVTEDAYDNVKAVETLLGQPPPWALDLPLKAEGWTARRYKK